MSAAAMLALREAIRGALLADAALLALLPASQVFDEAPASAQSPYVLFAEDRARDWSSADERGAEHLFALEVWSRHRGLHEALTIAARVVEIVDEAQLVLPAGQRLVLLRWTAAETGRRENGRLAFVRLRFRALTETA